MEQLDAAWDSSAQQLGDAAVAELRAVHQGAWRVERTGRSAEGTTTVSSQPDQRRGFWLRVEATFAGSALQTLREVLDTQLATRQGEWHELLLPGGGLVAHIDDRRDIFYFAYRSPWPLSHRECLYVKLVEPRDGGAFNLFYWAITDDALKPPDPARVRIDFLAAHFIGPTDDGMVMYDYIQSSNAKVHLPDFILRSIQVGILFKEVEGLRRAVANSAGSGRAVGT